MLKRLLDTAASTYWLLHIAEHLPANRSDFLDHRPSGAGAAESRLCRTATAGEPEWTDGFRAIPPHPETDAP